MKEKISVFLAFFRRWLKVMHLDGATYFSFVYPELVFSLFII